MNATNAPLYFLAGKKSCTFVAEKCRDQIAKPYDAEISDGECPHFTIGHHIRREGSHEVRMRNETGDFY